MDIPLQQPPGQKTAADELFYHIMSNVSDLEAEHNSLTKRIAYIHASLREYDSQRSILETGEAFASGQDIFDGGTQKRYAADMSKLRTSEVSSLGVDESKPQHISEPIHVDIDEQIEETNVPSLPYQTEHGDQPPALPIDDDFDSRACKLVNQVVIGKALLDPTDDCDVRTWLLHMAKALFEKGTAVRPTRRCLEMFADILEPSTFVRLKIFDEDVQAEDKAKEEAMLFCIQLFISNSEVGTDDNVPVVLSGAPPAFIISIEDSLASQKARRAARKDKDLRKAIEEGEKLGMLRRFFGQGIIHLISTEVWLSM